MFYKHKKSRLPISANLNGVMFKLYSTDGISIEYKLENQKISWAQIGTKEIYQTNFRATSIRDGIYLIDYIYENQPISVVLDLYKQVFTKIITQSVYGKSFQTLTHIKTMDVTIIQGSIDKPYKASYMLHNQTNELVGSSYLYYGKNNALYKHIYIDQNAYIRHCILGKNPGFSDTCPYYHFKIENQLYLMICTQKEESYLVIMLLDTQFNYADGKICYYDLNQKLKTIPVSPTFSSLNETNTNYTSLAKVNNNF